MNKFILLASSLLLSTGCTTLNKSQSAAAIEGVVKTDLKAEIAVDMSKKIKGAASSMTLFGFFEISGPEKFADGVFASTAGLLPFGGTDGIKAGAAYNAIKAGNVDVIVAPQYIVEKKNYFIFATTQAVVTGYPGTIKKIQ